MTIDEIIETLKKSNYSPLLDGEYIYYAADGYICRQRQEVCNYSSASAYRFAKFGKDGIVILSKGKKGGSNYIPVSSYLPSDQTKFLKTNAKENNCTVSDVIRKCIDFYMKNNAE